MQKYVEQRNNGYYVAGTRISLDSIVHQFRRGVAPESILRAFPLIGSLERVNGAIAFYQAHQAKVDEYLERQDDLWKRSREENPLPVELKSRLDQAREPTPRRRG